MNQSKTSRYSLPVVVRLH